MTEKKIDKGAPAFPEIGNSVYNSDRRTMPPALEPGVAALAPEPHKVRHKKRGTTYSVIGTGKMQAENWRDLVGLQQLVDGEDVGTSVDMREVAVYRSDDDGQIWVRPIEEFNDGRFEALSISPTPVDGEPTPSTLVTAVSREDTIKFLEIAIRNWSDVQELSASDITDVTTALQWFLRSQPPAPQMHVKPLDRLEEIAKVQKAYYDLKQREFPCLEDFMDEEGVLNLPADIGPLLQQCSYNGRYSEADWWFSTIQKMKAEAPSPQTHTVGRWRTFEDITPGYWGIELEDAGNDDDAIMYPIKIHRDTVARIVEAHNAALATEGKS